MRRKKSIISFIIIPIVIVIVAQGIVSIGALKLKGADIALDNNAVDIMAQTVENRKVILENEMLDRWSFTTNQKSALTQYLISTFRSEGIDTEEFLRNEDLQKTYLEAVFSECVSALQASAVNGLFLILASDQSADQSGEYNGFFVRDSDLNHQSATNTDLLMERGSKTLARAEGIPLDAAWTTKFSFSGNGMRAADDFFYKPYVAAMENSPESMKYLGYWSEPFILEDHYMDNHKMITYSIPIACDEALFGVLGIEISISYLEESFHLQELEKNQNAGYMLAIDLGDGKFRSMCGRGNLYELSAGKNKELQLISQKRKNFYQVKDVQIGGQNIYATVHALKLYNNFVPYENTGWVLIGFESENAIFGFSRSIFSSMLIAVTFGVIFGVLMIIILVGSVTRPIARLVNSVRGGVDGIHGFRKSGIREIDEIHEVVKILTDEQKQAEERIKEESEKYRMAVENSNDVYYTYDVANKKLEIINSDSVNGIWDCAEHPEYMDDHQVHPSDRKRLTEIRNNSKSEFQTELRIMKEGTDEYQWYLLNGKNVTDNRMHRTKIVGMLRNINERKLRELEYQEKDRMDPVTRFYRLDQGLDQLKEKRRFKSKGLLVLLNVDNYRTLNKHFGLIFGDLVMESFASLIRGEFKNHRNILVRSGADEIMIWAEEMEIGMLEEKLLKVRESFAELIHRDTVKLTFACGVAEGKEQPDEELLDQASAALYRAKNTGADLTVYRHGWKQSKVHFAPGKVVSLAWIQEMSMVSLALNLFDRDGDLAVVLDMLVNKMAEQYHPEAVLITVLDYDYMANMLEYRWHRKEPENTLPEVAGLAKQDLALFTGKCDMNRIQSLREDLAGLAMFKPFMVQEDGLVLHMEDSGKYMGSLLLFGTKPEELTEEGKKELREIVMLIQNRMNRERHDSISAAKAEFLARMSHEIRTPMNGIMGMTEIALNEGQSQEKIQDCLKKIKNTSEYLLGLLNDILDMSKIENGRMQLIQSDFDLQTLSENMYQLFTARITEKRIRYKQEIHIPHRRYHGDELRISQVLINLLGNAVKFTPENGEITLTIREEHCDESGTEIFFSVKDTGIGISKENHKKVFQSFEQADTRSSSRKQGNGLGLAISSRLVRLMGSEILLDSEIGKGSEFSFTLHLSYAVNQTADSETEIHENKKEICRFDGRKILVAEDNSLNLEIIRTILEEYHIQVDSAENGRQAVECMRDTPAGTYDMIFMDIMMPEMNGLEATEAIRKMDRSDCREIPIVAMSANAFDEDVKKSIASGMNAHLSKPLDLGKLKKVLQKYLK